MDINNTINIYSLLNLLIKRLKNPIIMSFELVFIVKIKIINIVINISYLILLFAFFTIHI